MENERKYTPINLDKLKDISSDINDKKNPEKGSSPLIESFKSDYFNREIFKYESYGAYFLDKLEELKLPEMGDFSDDEKWKEKQTIEEWNSVIEEKIKEDPNKPFQIKIPYSLEKEFEKNGLIQKDSYPNFFYIPDSMKGEIKRFNEYREKVLKDEAEENLFRGIKNINLN